MYGIRGFGRGGHRPPPGSEAISSAKQFSLRRIGRHFFPFFLRQRKRILLGSICLVITLALGKAPPLLTRYLVDQVLLPFQKVPWTAERYQTALGLGALVVGAMVLIAAGNYIFSSIRIRVIREAGITLVRDIRQHVYSHLQKLSLRYYDSTQTGEVMSRLTGDVDAIERFFGSVSDRLIVNILNLMITVVIIFYLNWRLALVALIPVPVLVSVMLHFSRKVRPVFRQIRDRMGEIHAKLQDNISGIRVIRAFNREPEEMERFSEKNESFYQSQRQGVNLFSRFFPLIHFIDGSGMILVTAVGGWMLLQRDTQLTIGDLFAFNAFVIQLYQPIGVLFQSYASVLQTGASAERIAELLEEEPDVADDPDAVDLPPVQGEVRFEQVGFHYQDGIPVLKNIDLHVQPGQTVALVGHSGAGKTTMVNLLARFYDPTEGRILIDGYDIRHVRQQSLRDQISIVLQDNFLFHGSVIDNIRYARPDASREEVEAAAHAAFAHDFIMELPDGYDTIIGERGIKLSGGQRQRIAIARALLADRRILILDEATSMLDTSTEHQIRQALANLLRSRTCFVIAHRLSTIRHADLILVIEDGEIVERGSHEELIACNGHYARMCREQFMSEEVFAS